MASGTIRQPKIKHGAKRPLTESYNTVKAQIHITLKAGVLDPQGKAIESALSGLGFDGISNVRQGKLIELDLTESDHDKARTLIDNMCTQLLANTVIEDFAIELDD